MKLFRHAMLLLAAVPTVLTMFDARAEAPVFQFRNITVERGLASDTVRSICTDSRGFVWIGTAEGLNLYDGVRIMRIPLDPANPERGKNYINTIFEDSRGVLWVGTDAGVWFMPSDAEAGREDFRPLEARTRDGAGVDAIVTQIAEDLAGNIWIATRGQTLFRYTPADETLTHFSVAETSNDVECVGVDSNNTVWVSLTYSECPLYTLNRATDQFVEARLRYEDCRPTRVQAVLEDAAGDLWFGTWDRGLQRCDPKSRTVRPYLADGDVDGLMMHIHSVAEYLPGELLVGSDDGLAWVNTATHEYRLYTNDRTDEVSLTDRFVYPIVKDAEGGVWVGTYYGGVNYIAPNSGQFERYSMSRLAGSSEGYVVSCFCEDADGNIWVGSDNGGLMCFSPETRSMVSHYIPDESRDGIAGRNVHALCADGRSLWVGTYTGGLGRLDIDSGTFRTYNASGDASSLDNDSVYAVFRDGEGRIWAATISGIHLYNRGKDSFVRIRTLGVITTDIEQTADGDMWFATSGSGIFRYAPATGVWRRYCSSACGLSCDYVSSLFVQPSGRLWAATHEGVFGYDEMLDDFALIPETGRGSIACVIGDGTDLWLTTTRGLWRYSTTDGTVERFTRSDGLVGEQFMENSGIITSEGKIYVGSTRGFNAFMPHRIYRNRYVPPVVITGLTISDRNTEVEAIRAVVGTDDEVVLPYNRNNIRISFAALSYCAPEKNRYSYILEGFDKQWRDAAGAAEASYTNLPAGHYKFRVVASNNDGVWNETGASTAIIVRPHPLYSTVAKIVYALLALAALVVGWMISAQRSKKRTSESFYQIFSTRNAEEIRAKVQFMTMIAHEIRTPVSLIIGPLEKIMSRVDQLPAVVGADLRIIDRNGKRLLQLINQMLDFRNMSPDGGMSLHVDECAIKPLLVSICDRFRPTMTAKGIEFRQELPESDFVAMVDGEALTKIVSNLLSNAVKYTRSRVGLRCGVDFVAGTFAITVVDDGAGLKPSERKKVFVPLYRADESKQGTGLGLTIVKNLVDMHHGTVSVDAGEWGGSEFKVVMPLTQPYASMPEAADDEAEAVEEEKALTPMNEEGALTLLVVEDDADMLEFLVDSFKEKYSVIPVSNGDDALDVLRRRNVTLIISDWMMPGISGADLCRRVRANQSWCHIPFILLTAKADYASSLESLDCGADAHVKKPFSLVYLQAMVDHLINIREMLMHKYSGLSEPSQQSVSSNQADEEFLAKMKALIEANLSNVDFSVKMLAEKMCVSRSGLFAKVRQLLGVTPNRLIMNTRLKAAARILLEGKYPVNVVGYMVGFNDPSYFAKCFVRQFGMRPKEWIDKHNERHEEDDSAV